MSRKCVVEMHLDHKTGHWWAGCSDHRFSAAADEMSELKTLVYAGHPEPFLWDLVVDNAPPTNTASDVEWVVDWTVA